MVSQAISSFTSRRGNLSFSFCHPPVVASPRPLLLQHQSNSLFAGVPQAVRIILLGSRPLSPGTASCQAVVTGVAGGALEESICAMGRAQGE